jgi:hypothetical protein
MNSAFHKPLQFGLTSLFGITAIAALAALIARDGNRASLWGPLMLLAEASHDALALVVACLLTLTLVGAMASFPVRPTPGTAMLACLAALIWLLLGALGIAIHS